MNDSPPIKEELARAMERLGLQAKSGEVEGLELLARAFDLGFQAAVGSLRVVADGFEGDGQQKRPALYREAADELERAHAVMWERNDER